LLLFIYLINKNLLLEAFNRRTVLKTMSQYQAGSSGPPVKRLKQKTALTWKVKDKTTSQLAKVNE